MIAQFIRNDSWIINSVCIIVIKTKTYFIIKSWKPIKYRMVTTRMSLIIGLHCQEWHNLTWSDLGPNNKPRSTLEPLQLWPRKSEILMKQQLSIDLYFHVSAYLYVICYWSVSVIVVHRRIQNIDCSKYIFLREIVNLKELEFSTTNLRNLHIIYVVSLLPNISKLFFHSSFFKVFILSWVNEAF